MGILEKSNQDEHEHLVGSGRCHLLVSCRQGKGGGGAGGDVGVRDRLDRRRLKLLLSSALLRILSESIGVSRDVHLGSWRPACIYPQPSRAGSDHEVDTAWDYENWSANATKSNGGGCMFLDAQGAWGAENCAKKTPDWNCICKKPL